MFSQLGPLFKTTFRQAEANDTRQAIPHDERDKNKRKEEEENTTAETKDLWTDDTSVTVDALQAFLINFLNDLSTEDNETEQTQNIEQDLSARPPEKIRPTNTKNAKAVRAYQARAEGSYTPAQTTLKQNTEPTLQSKELRDIYRLISDLNILSQRGVQSLSILQADSFIESLKNAVILALSKI